MRCFFGAPSFRKFNHQEKQNVKKQKRKLKKQRKVAVKLTPVQKLKRAVRDLKVNLADANVREQRLQANLDYRGQRATEDAQRAAQALADKQKAIAARDEVIAQKDAVIRLRDERIVDLTNERNRIVRIVDQFTSVQITSHGTEMRVSSSATSTPDKLRLPVPGLVSAQIDNTPKQMFKEAQQLDVGYNANADKYRTSKWTGMTAAISSSTAGIACTR